MPDLLPQKYRDQLGTWIGKTCHFRLLYKISRDGCSAQTFHQKCDGQGATVTVLYNTNNTIYGGYLSQSWNSNGRYISDSKAFLFRLQYNGISNAFAATANNNSYDNEGDKYCFEDEYHRKYQYNSKSVKSSRDPNYSDYGYSYAGYGDSDYGPTFGGNHDLRSFTGTISKSGNQFALNGSLNMSGGYYNYNGQDTNSITNNNLTVTDLEVYLVLDGPGPRVVDKPWREPPEWNTEALHSLKEYVSKYHPVEDTNVPTVNILLIGQVGAGKSSFFNTINSIFRGEITSRACTGSAGHSLTTTLRKYRVREPSSGQYLNMRLCDMRGLEESVGVKTQDIALVLDGHLPEHHQFNPTCHATPKSPGFERDPKLKDKIHTVAYVIDSSTIDVMNTTVVQQMKEIHSLSVERGIPQVIYLTKLDKICPDVDDDVKSIFTSSDCKTAVDTIADVIGVPRSHVFPVKNYERETRLHTPIDILALSALRQTLVFADDFLEDQNEFT